MKRKLTPEQRENAESFELLKQKWAKGTEFSKKYGVKKAKLQSKLPSYAIPEGRSTRHIPSVAPVGAVMVAKRSPMDPRELAKESPDVAQATIDKSNSLVPMYNKGAPQYVTAGIDVTTIGSRSRRM